MDGFLKMQDNVIVHSKSDWNKILTADLDRHERFAHPVRKECWVMMSFVIVWQPGTVFETFRVMCPGPPPGA